MGLPHFKGGFWVFPFELVFEFNDLEKSNFTVTV